MQRPRLSASALSAVRAGRSCKDRWGWWWCCCLTACLPPPNSTTAVCSISPDDAKISTDYNVSSPDSLKCSANRANNSADFTFRSADLISSMAACARRSADFTCWATDLTSGSAACTKRSSDCASKSDSVFARSTGDCARGSTWHTRCWADGARGSAVSGSRGCRQQQRAHSITINHWRRRGKISHRLYHRAAPPACCTTATEQQHSWCTLTGGGPSAGIGLPA